MNQKLIRLQILACGALGAGLVGEWAYSRFTASELQSQLAAREQIEFQAEELPSIADDPRTVDSYNDIVERPVFIEGRKPVAEANSTENSQTLDAGQIDDWLLIGVYSKGDKPFALFSKRNEAKKYLKITEDQTISGWRLGQIHADHVVLQQAGQQKSVALRKPRAQIKPTPGKPAVPQRPPVQPNVNAKPIEQAPNEIPETLNDN